MYGVGRRCWTGTRIDVRAVYEQSTGLVPVLLLPTCFLELIRDRADSSEPPFKPT